MKQRNATATKPAAAAAQTDSGSGTVVAASRRRNSSRTESKNHRSPSSLVTFSPGLVNLFIFVILGLILFGITCLHIKLDHLEAKDSTQIIAYSNSKGNRNYITTVSEKQVISNNHIEGRGAGSARGTVRCDVDVSSFMSYWDDPLSDADRLFRSPFLENPLTLDELNTKPKERRYLSFEPDPGGFNNIRIEFEIMFVFAAATGRTLILPPDTPFYLLQRDSKVKHRGLMNFFHRFDDVVDVVSTEEFYKEEVLGKNLFSLPRDEETRTKLLNSISKCNFRINSENSCVPVFDHLSEIAAFVPDWNGEHHCLVMDDKNWYRNAQTNITVEMHRFCGTRQPAFYNVTIHDAPLLHFRTGINHKETRLLAHFYAFIYFVNPRVGNFYKRLVRNRCRYSDEIFCSGGKIVQALSDGNTDANINHTLSSYSSMHIRRGDFQWKKMRISSDEWFENTKEIFYPGETIYIATGQFSLLTNCIFQVLFMSFV